MVPNHVLYAGQYWLITPIFKLASIKETIRDRICGLRSRLTIGLCTYSWSSKGSFHNETRLQENFISFLSAIVSYVFVRFSSRLYEL